MPDQVVLTAQKATAPKWIVVTIALIIAASLATNVLFVKTYYDLKKGDAAREQIINDQKDSIDRQNKLIEGYNTQITALVKIVGDLDVKKGVIDEKKKNDGVHYGKPLPRPEEDKFFVDNGFKGKREDDNGRVFTNADVVKVQLLVTENQNLKSELAIAYDKIGVQSTMIETYKAKCMSQDQIIASYKEIDEQRQKEIQKYKLEVATNKFYKWTAIIVGGAVAGAAIAHH